MNNVSAERFSRQLRLHEIGIEGQRRLLASGVLVVGCGGLGSPVIQYLAGAGVGRLTLVDDDVVEASNLNRQMLHRQADIGRKKVERAREWVEAAAPDIEVKAVSDRLTVRNAREMVQGYDLVIDCTDGLPVKYLLNDSCVLEGVPLVHGAATAFSGQVLVVPPGGRPCLRCLFGEIPPPDWIESCQTAGILGAFCGIIGSFMACEAVKTLIESPSNLSGRFLSVDGMGPDVCGFPVTVRKDCAVCGAEPTIDARAEEDYAPTCSAALEP